MDSSFANDCPRDILDSFKKFKIWSDKFHQLVYDFYRLDIDFIINEKNKWCENMQDDFAKVYGEFNQELKSLRYRLEGL